MIVLNPLREYLSQDIKIIPGNNDIFVTESFVGSLTTIPGDFAASREIETITHES